MINNPSPEMINIFMNIYTVCIYFLSTDLQRNIVCDN